MTECSISEKAFIYALKDPRTNATRYIGWTQKPNVRLNGHISSAKLGRTHCHNWIKSLLNLGLSPVMEIIEETDLEHYVEREQFWIALCRFQGINITNISSGGDGAPGTKLSEEAKLNLSRVAKAQNRRPPHTPEAEAKRRRALTGRRDSPEVRRKKSVGRQGMRFSATHKKALSIAKKKFFATEKGKAAAEQYSRFFGSLTDEQVLEVWALAWSEQITQTVIAQRFGIPTSCVSEIKHGKTYKHVKRPSGNTA